MHLRGFIKNCIYLEAYFPFEIHFLHSIKEFCAFLPHIQCKLLSARRRVVLIKRSTSSGHSQRAENHIPSSTSRQEQSRRIPANKTSLSTSPRFSLGLERDVLLKHKLSNGVIFF